MKTTRSKYKIITAFLLGLIVAGTACGESATATPIPEPIGTPIIDAMGDMMEGGEAIVIELVEQNNSGQTGTAILIAVGGKTEVAISATAGISGIQHIHSSICEPLGALAYDLGTLGADGTSVTLVDASFDSLTTGTFAINLHSKGNKNLYTSCGEISILGSGDTVGEGKSEDFGY